MDCSQTGFSALGILQARILEWVTMSHPGDLPRPGTKSASSAALTLAGGSPLSRLGIRSSSKQDANTFFSVWQTLRGSVAPRSPADVSTEVGTEGWGHKGERCWVDQALRASYSLGSVNRGRAEHRHLGQKGRKEKAPKAGTHWPEKYKTVTRASVHSIPQ